MEAATNGVQNESETIREASRLYNVPFEMLRRRVNGSVIPGSRPGPATVLTEAEEQLQARWNRSGWSDPGPTKNRRPCRIIIITTLASCLAATSAGGGASFLDAKCVNRIPVHCS